jgi:hypothetical protein
MERDLPVLDAAVAMLEDSPMVADAAITERTGFDLADVRRALEALDMTYVHLGRDMGGFFVDAVTADARRGIPQRYERTGQPSLATPNRWPSASGRLRWSRQVPCRLADRAFTAR